VLALHQDAFVRDAERLADDPYLGWSLGAWDLRDLGLYGYSILNAPDLRRALRLLVDLSRLETTAAQLILHETADDATLVQTWLPNTTKCAAWLHIFLCVLRQLVGPDFVPRRLGLHMSEPARRDGFCDRAGMPVDAQEAPIAFVTFDARLLDRPMQNADSDLARVLRRCSRLDQAQFGVRSAELNHMARAIVPLLALDRPTMATVSALVGLSTAALQRRLDDLGCSLPDLVDAVRSGLSTQLLTKPNMTIVRATRALGFDQPEALMNAYRRWWGRPLGDGRGRPVRYA
jgi:AraC-like DNA-binding protein